MKVGWTIIKPSALYMPVQIRTQKLAQNYQLIQQRVNGQLIAVIKADAYGHGAVEVYKALEPHCDIFAVATVSEALILRSAGATKRIMVLSDIANEEGWVAALNSNIEPVVYTSAQLTYLEYASVPPRIWLKYDSGMHRSGLNRDECYEAHALCTKRGIEIIALLSHLASAEDPADDTLTQKQLSNTEGLAKELNLAVSLANSAACWRFGKEWQHEYFRTGISLYGMSPFSDRIGSDLGIEPTMQLSSTISQIRTVKAGEGVGYNLTWKAQRDSQIALIPIGYADGYPRMASGSTNAIRSYAYLPRLNTKVAVVGRVSMDLITLDITDSTAEVGDEVELWGDNIALETVASAAQTISYEILTHSGLAKRRGYVYG